VGDRGQWLRSNGARSPIATDSDTQRYPEGVVLGDRQRTGGICLDDLAVVMVTHEPFGNIPIAFSGLVGPVPDGVPHLVGEHVVVVWRQVDSDALGKRTRRNSIDLDGLSLVILPDDLERHPEPSETPDVVADLVALVRLEMLCCRHQPRSARSTSRISGVST